MSPGTKQSPSLGSAPDPPDRLEPMLDARVTRAEGGMLLGLIERRVNERMPVPYLIGRALG